MQEKSKNSKKIQEDENGSPREPNNTLQVVILQKNSMDESLDFELYATNLKTFNLHLPNSSPTFIYTY